MKIDVFLIYGESASGYVFTEREQLRVDRFFIPVFSAFRKEISESSGSHRMRLVYFLKATLPFIGKSFGAPPQRVVVCAPSVDLKMNHSPVLGRYTATSAFPSPS